MIAACPDAVPLQEEIARLRAMLQEAELALRQSHAEALYAAPTQLQTQPQPQSQHQFQVQPQLVQPVVMQQTADRSVNHLSQQMTQSQQHIAVPEMTGWGQPQAIPVG